MLQNLISPIALFISLTTSVGILMHDTQIDRATTVALALPTAVMSLAAVDTAIKFGDAHTHVERAGIKHLSAFRTNVPRLQPRDDDFRFLQNKKSFLDGSDSTSLWPSV